MTKEIITQERLNCLFKYCQETGNLIRKISTSPRAQAGMIAGTKTKLGYVRISIGGRGYLAHRLIWVMHFGYFPIEIDHINHNGRDNRLSNLVEVSHKTNSKNQTLRNTNTSGVNGVYWSKQTSKWVASITVNYKTIPLGYFSRISDAKKAREAADIKYGFHKNHGAN